MAELWRNVGEDTFFNLASTAQIGDVVKVNLPRRDFLSFRFCEGGLVFRTDAGFFFNDDREPFYGLPPGGCEDWCPFFVNDLRGVYISTGSGFSLFHNNYDRGKIVFRGSVDSPVSHRLGCLFSSGNSISLNREQIYAGGWDQYRPHPHGVVVRVGEEFHLHQSITAHSSRKSWNLSLNPPGGAWGCCSSGILYSQKNHIFLHKGEGEKYQIVATIDPEKCFWAGHSRGVTIYDTYRNSLELHVLS